MIDFITKRFDGKKTLEDLESCYEGMAEAFKGVVMLLVAAGFCSRTDVDWCD